MQITYMYVTIDDVTSPWMTSRLDDTDDTPLFMDDVTV